MANIHPHQIWGTDPFAEVEFKSYDYAIGGKLVVAHASFSEDYSDMLSYDADAKYNVKMSLATQMAKYMVDNNLVEFTQIENREFGGKRIAARAYLAPNEQVKILRLANKIV
jgi:hypothetical protein